MEKKIAAGEFKAKCLQLMDQVAETRAEYVITKRGKPVARLVPIDAPKKPKSGWGACKGMVTILGDIVAPIYTREELEAFDARRARLIDDF